MFRQGERFHPYHSISGPAKPFEFDCILGVVSYSAAIMGFSLLLLFPQKKKVASFEMDGEMFLCEDTIVRAVVDEGLASPRETFVR